ncbi:dipeptidase [Ruegeria marina]|uniref:Membrane dipeptidase n=1 Tax=Ruegeria marina TaxID=639004 RepID=A0A1G6SFI1_9RHOB|nr:membrane dipeptidase [Ruegeria marina]SDD15411.1 membrane dipeptidase [Ruegeria marina]
MLIFDGHNDVLTELSRAGGRAAAPGFLTGLPGQMDLPRARKGGFGGGFFALWSRSDGLTDFSALGSEYDVPLPDPVPDAQAWEMIRAQTDTLLALEEFGALRICTSTAQIARARADGVLSAILHLEGAEGIGPDFHELEELYALGLRSLGPVWSRPNVFGHGVPFRYPSGPDIGPGLTERGRELIARCEEMGILVDLSHLNLAGFRDVAEISKRPLVATHSNAHAVVPHARNLTDAQLRIMAESGGLAGLNYESTFVRPDGRPDDDIPPGFLLAQLDHLIDRLGEEGVGLGSDFDGCTPPRWLNTVDNLPALVQAMEQHGYTAARIERICWGNWMRVLAEVWRERH